MPAGIEWIFAQGIDRLGPEIASACVLALDLGDPAAAPLLRPAPLASDLRDEIRPGAADRRHFLARRAALRSFVARHLGVEAETIEIAYDAAGAPRLHQPAVSLHVSVSARGSLALLALSDKPVGIDFEPETPTEPMIDVLHPTERVELASLEGSARMRRFLDIWTAKEAYLKALGDGLNRDPSGIATAFTATGVTISDAGAPVALAASECRALEVNGVPIIASCIVRAD